MSPRVPKAPALTLCDTVQELRLQVQRLPWHLAQKWAGFRQAEGQKLQQIEPPGLLLMWKDYRQVIPCFCQLCPLVYLPLLVTSQEGSAHGDTLAPLLPIPAAEAREEMTTLCPFPVVPTSSTLFPHPEPKQTGHKCKPTPAIQPGKQLEEDSTWARPNRHNICLKTGSLLVLTFCEWLLREIHSSLVYTQALFWQIKKNQGKSISLQYRTHQ